MLFMTQTITSSYVNIGLECPLIVFYPEAKKALVIIITAILPFLKHITSLVQHIIRFIYDFTQIFPSNILNLFMDQKLVILCMSRRLPMSETTIWKWGCQTVIPRPHLLHTRAWNILLCKMGNVSFSQFWSQFIYLFYLKIRSFHLKSW